MRICYFGLFDPEYERNRVLISGLRQNGVEVVVCTGHGKGIHAYWRLLKSWWATHIRYNLVIVGYSDTRFSVILARILFRCPLVWDAFYSLYDSYVFDRKLVAPSSIKAGYYWLIDFLCCKIASRILLDTSVHVEYFRKTFYVNKQKLICSLVGASPDIFRSLLLTAPHHGFRILFFGNFTPLQGIAFILRAAKLLEHAKEVRFDIIGSGQTYNDMCLLAEKLQVPNVLFHERKPIHELVRAIADADVCLGIFGETGKTQRVIPNKVYEAIAMKKPVLTADTPAIRELFIDHENILLCRVADPEDLAKKINLLINNRTLREHIAVGGFEAYQANCTPAIIGSKLLDVLKRAI